MKYMLMLLLTLPGLQAQTIQEKPVSKSNYKFDLQGHRGARGLAPENTLPAFQKAMELDVNTIELDLAITKDHKIIVSHEPWMNADICLDPEGKPIEKENEKSYNIYQMTYDEVKAFDCGSKYNPAFPEQNLETAYKPLLKEVLNMVDSLSRNHGKKIKYNIEIKSLPEGDGIFHPKPEEFVRQVVKLLEEETDVDKVNLQSFDFRVLKEIHKTYPEIKLAALVYNSDFDTALKELGFIPDIYSPYYPLVNQEMIKQAHRMEMKVIPWTVNDLEAMSTLLRYGVDGIITDYPDLALKLKK